MKVAGRINAAADRGDDGDIRTVNTSANSGFAVVGVKGESRFHPPREQLAP